MQEIALDDIEFNKYNSRTVYSDQSVARLAKSLGQRGQLCTIKVRPKPGKDGKYEVIFGHRRVLAARKLGWRTISATVVEATEEQMMVESLIENVQREDLCDYEKAITFEKIHTQFGKSYEEIGEIAGLSKQRVSDYIAMSKLFDPDFVATNPDIADSLSKITEHHARVISRVEKQTTRADLVRMVVAEDLSVRGLENVLYRFRSWFGGGASNSNREAHRAHLAGLREDRIGEIRGVIERKFKLAELGDYVGFSNLYLFEEGYSVYPLIENALVQGATAVSYKKRWFFEFMPQFTCKVRIRHVDFPTPEVAVATMMLCYCSKGDATRRITARGTVILLHRPEGWKIFHEHWSSPNQSAEVLNMVRIAEGTAKRVHSP